MILKSQKLQLFNSTLAEIILTAIDQYIKSQLAQSGGNQHKKKGEVVNIENSRDWKHLLKFKKLIEEKL